MFTSSAMYKLTVMNMTTAAIEETDTIFRAALIFEWILITIGFGETMILWYLLRYTNQYHRNLAMIVEQLPNQYFPSLLARMWMIYKQLTIPNTALLIEDQSFLFAVWLRNSLLFIAFYFAPFPVFERCFATVFMHDYETNKRRWISYFLSGLLYLISFTSAQFFIFGGLPRETHIVLITSFNLLAFTLTFIMEHWNVKKYRKLRVNANSDYTLSARAQLSENINSTKPFKVMCFSIAFFAFVCTSILHVDEYTDSQAIKNWVYVAFNYSCWSYGTVVPFFMLAYNRQWQKELKRWKNSASFPALIFGTLLHLNVFQMCGCFQRNRVTSENEKQVHKVKDSFGKNCFVDDKEHTTIYFSQLNAEWNMPPEQDEHSKNSQKTGKKRRDSKKDHEKETTSAAGTRRESAASPRVELD